MDYLYSRINVRNNQNLRKTLSNTTVYVIPDLSNNIAYNDELKLDDNQWFKLPGFSEKDYCPSYLKDGINNINTATLEKKEFDQIKFLISHQDNKYYLFQRVLQSNILTKRKFIEFKEEPKIEKDKTMVIINDVPDAIYNKETDELYFKDISRIRPFFKGIEELLKEATDEEIDNFLGLDIIKLTDGFDKTKVSLSNRKRVRIAMDQYKALGDEEKERLREYIKKYQPKMEYDEATKQFSLGSDDDFKILVFGIDQRYYTTEVSKQQRVAHSVTAIENKDE